MSILNYYNDNARRLFSEYQSIDPDSLHSVWSDFMPREPWLALDVGGGSGRDSLWLARKGWRVIAVEPAAGLMKLGMDATRLQDVTWMDDSLPLLAGLENYLRRFKLILVSGVLMHLDRKERAQSMKTLAALMVDDSVLVVTIRNGTDAEGRKFHHVSPDEIAESAVKQSLQIAAMKETPDKLGRPGVVWETIVIRKK